MTAREELAEIIQDCGEYIPGSHADDYVSPDKAAEAILAAGYRKPRTVTTVEELDALPLGSVILDQVGLSLHRNAFTGWCSSNGAKEIPMDMLMQEALPATVLHEGVQS